MKYKSEKDLCEVWAASVQRKNGRKSGGQFDVLHLERSRNGSPYKEVCVLV